MEKWSKLIELFQKKFNVKLEVVQAKRDQIKFKAGFRFVLFQKWPQAIFVTYMGDTFNTNKLYK